MRLIMYNFCHMSVYIYISKTVLSVCTVKFVEENAKSFFGWRGAGGWGEKVRQKGFPFTFRCFRSTIPKRD